MSKLVVSTILVILGFTSFGFAASAAGPGSPRIAPPVILSTVPDFKENTVIISGRNFGSTPPIVRLAEQVVKVKGFSETKIIASLALNIQPGTYGLTVTASGRAQSDSFGTALFAAGN